MKCQIVYSKQLMKKYYIAAIALQAFIKREFENTRESVLVQNLDAWKTFFKVLESIIW